MKERGRDPPSLRKGTNIVIKRRQLIGIFFFSVWVFVSVTMALKGASLTVNVGVNPEHQVGGNVGSSSIAASINRISNPPDLSSKYQQMMFAPEPSKPKSQKLLPSKDTFSDLFETRPKTQKVEDKSTIAFDKNHIKEGGLDHHSTSGIFDDEVIKGREKLVDILHDAGEEEIDTNVIASLPQWNEVTKLYGGNTVIIGLEHCEEFRRNRPIDDTYIGVAGMFNTGTNALAQYLRRNCVMPHNIADKKYRGIRLRVPWGKHSLASMKWNNTAKGDEQVNKTNVMPVVLVRDPYSWMQSMCRSPYNARWDHSKRCPNLINKKTQRPNPLRYSGPEIWFDSLAHLWTQYYSEYLEASYPRIIVRFEDMLFHAKEVVDTICQCAGGTSHNPKGKFTYVLGSAKGRSHTSKTNMITAMIKYGNDKLRFKNMTDEDMKFASSVFTPEWMNLFQYEMPQVAEGGLVGSSDIPFEKSILFTDS